MTLHTDRLTTLASLEQFLAGTAGMDPQPAATTEAGRQAHVLAVLRQFHYATLPRADKGLVLRYLRHTSGYSRQHLTRLIARYRARVPLGQRKPPTRGFNCRYTEDDVVNLAKLDAVHENLSGPATRHLCERAWTVYHDARYQRLATISVAHLYNLRQRQRYRQTRGHWEPTRPSRAVSIALRQPPRPEGRAGFIRIDSVHQGDYDGAKGVYYIDAVDCVTQWQVVACCEHISEAFLLPVLKQLLACFPFAIRGVHADNGSEYINFRVARLLKKLHAEFTKSRPLRSNDNALVEAKNGVVIRRTFGYAHIPQHHAQRINRFCAESLVPYLNLHRPCLFPRHTPDAKGKIRTTYPPELVQTPLEKLVSLPPSDRNLKPGVTLQSLLATAHATSDNDAAAQLQKARSTLFTTFHRRTTTQAA
ncbi:MAG TPA: hypothetical protein VF292_04915 [Rhodanobacteraceae bacterium]